MQRVHRTRLSLACSAIAGLALSAAVAGAGPPPAQVALHGEIAAVDYSLPEYIRRAPVLPPSLSRTPPRQMGLAEARELAMRNNLGLELEREKVRAVSELRPLALSLYEPTLQLSAGRLTAQSPPATAQEGRAGQVLRSTSDNWNLTLSERLPTGGALRLDFTNSRAESSLGTAVAPLLYRSTLQLSLTQPLLRDFSFSGRVQWAPVLRAQFDSEAARETARLRAMVTVKMTEDAYWSLVESLKSYEVNVGAEELARHQLELTRRQIAAGTLPESDLIGVLGTLSQRQVSTVRAEAQIETAADVLRKLLNLPAGEWEQPLLPLDTPSFLREPVELPSALERALSARPELKQVQIDLRRIALDLDVAKNARLPRLNLTGAVGTVGQDGDYQRALQQVGDRSSWQWSVGADLSWAPIGVGVRAELSRLESVLRQNHLGREQLVLDIRQQIRAAARAIDTAERQLLAAARYRDLAERSLDIEQRRFLNGISSNFVVGQRQAELSQARLAEVQSLIQHERARSDLQLAIGELLEARRITFELRGAAR